MLGFFPKVAVRVSMLSKSHTMVTELTHQLHPVLCVCISMYLCVCVYVSMCLWICATSRQLEAGRLARTRQSWVSRVVGLAEVPIRYAMDG